MSIHIYTTVDMDTAIFTKYSNMLISNLQYMAVSKQASKQASKIHTHNAVLLVRSSLRVAPMNAEAGVEAGVEAGIRLVHPKKN